MYIQCFTVTIFEVIGLHTPRRIYKMFIIELQQLIGRISDNLINIVVDESDQGLDVCARHGEHLLIALLPF